MALPTTVGEFVFYNRIFAKQHFGPFAGGLELADTLRAGKDIRMRQLAGGPSPLQNANRLVLTKNLFKGHNLNQPQRAQRTQRVQIFSITSITFL